MIDLIYFSWIRERIGKSVRALKQEQKLLLSLLKSLKKKDVRYSEVFSDLGSFRVAINQELASFDASIIEAKEIAFFPPMTGG